MGAGEDFTYVGESSRSGYERAINHLDDYKAKHEDSYMWGHALTHHGGRVYLRFKFVIVKIFQLDRYPRQAAPGRGGRT